MNTYGYIGEFLVACPHCHEYATVPKPDHAETIVAYTDGKWAFRKPGFHEPLMKCWRCEQLAWKNEAMQFECDPKLSFWARWRLRQLKPPNEADYWHALESGFSAGSLEKEVVLRTHCWWKSNDPYRDHRDIRKPAPEQRSTQWKHNLELLPGLRKDRVAQVRRADREGTEHTRVMGWIGLYDSLVRSDAYRQLGRFEEALAELDQIADDPGVSDHPDIYRRLADFHRQLIEQRNLHVQAYSRPTS